MALLRLSTVRLKSLGLRKSEQTNSERKRTSIIASESEGREGDVLGPSRPTDGFMYRKERLVFNVTFKMKLKKATPFPFKWGGPGGVRASVHPISSNLRPHQLDIGSAASFLTNSNANAFTGSVMTHVSFAR